MRKTNATESQKAESTDETPTHWVLIRGLGREAGHWGEFPQILAAAIPGSKVTCLDLPGAGRHHTLSSPLTVGAITDFVRAEFDLVRSAEKRDDHRVSYHLVSISLGGMVASDWLDRYPGDFSSATLINTSFKSYSPIYQRLTFEAAYHILNVLRSDQAVERETHVLKMVSNRPELRERVARQWAELSVRNPVSHLNFMRQLLAASRFSPKLQAPPVPVLLLVSERDRMVDPACTAAIGRRWGLEVRRHPTAGHDLPLDDATWVASEIHRFWLRQREINEAKL